MSQPISPLVAQVIQAQAAMTADTTNAVIAGLERQVSELRARSAAVEAGILALLAGPWMPTSEALRAALRPSVEAVNAHLRAIVGDTGERMCQYCGSRLAQIYDLDGAWCGDECQHNDRVSEYRGWYPG